jgi:hypothetical protein
MFNDSESILDFILKMGFDINSDKVIHNKLVDVGLEIINDDSGDYYAKINLEEFSSLVKLRLYHVNKSVSYEKYSGMYRIRTVSVNNRIVAIRGEKA